MGSSPHPVRQWRVAQPGAPPRPIVPELPQRPTRGERPEVRTWLIVVAMLVIFVVGGVVSTGELGAGWVGFVLFGPIILSWLRELAVSAVADRRWKTAMRRRHELVEQARQWDGQNLIRWDEFPDGPVGEHADRLVAAFAALKGTRAYREGWVGDDWRYALHTRCWSLLWRLRDSVAVRDDLAEAADLSDEHPDLSDVVTERTAEITALDTEVLDTTTQLERLTTEARDLDAALDAADIARAKRERADELLERLGPDASMTGHCADEHRIRDWLAGTDTAGTDLSILGAGLRAATDYLTRQEPRDS